MARPEVWLNCAVSRDGRLANPDGSPLRLSNPEDLRRVHEMRARTDAILVGVETVLQDDPSLLVKAEYSEGDHPIRVVLDGKGRTPQGSRVLNGEAPTIVFSGPKGTTVLGAHQVRVPAKPLLDLDAVLAALAAMGVRSVMVEGGERILRSFLNADCWDAFTVFEAPRDVGGDGPRLWDASPDELNLAAESDPLGDGRLLRFSRA